MGAKRKTAKGGGALIELSGDVKRSIVAIFLFVLAFVSLLGFFGGAALLGEAMDTTLGRVFGWGKWLAPVIFALIGIVLLKRKERTLFYVTNSVGFLLAFVSALGLLHIFFDVGSLQERALLGDGGGYIGFGIAVLLHKFTGMVAGVVILAALLLVSALISLNLSILPVFRRFAQSMAGAREQLSTKHAEYKKSKNSDEQIAQNEDESEDEDGYEGDEEYSSEKSQAGDSDDKAPDFGENIKSVTFNEQKNNIKVPSDPVTGEVAQSDMDSSIAPSSAPGDVAQITPSFPKPKKSKSGSNWKIPPTTLVEASSGDAHAGDTADFQNTIVKTFDSFGIHLTPAEIIIGPTVTQYAFVPPAGIKLSRITALSNDLALALAKHPIRIEAPIPGKSLIGIEVPNKETASVRMRDALRNREFPYRQSGLQLALGKDVAGKYAIADLAKMPHLLVAGSTGAGKSVAVNAMIVSMLYQNTPEDLRFIMIDPKRVELSLYNGIPHLLTEVIVDNNKVLAALKWAVGEMDRRYTMLQSIGARDIVSYNQKVADGQVEPGEHTKLPAIVIVIDEMADLMASHGKEVEGVIVRLAQMARAIGIHLILSTQRPSVEVITGLIKANIPTRIALRVSTQIDSRTILDMPGAEKLLGRGDMLLKSPNHPQAKRIQSIFVSEEEVKAVADFLREQQWPEGSDDGLDEIIESAQTSGSAGMNDFLTGADAPSDQDPLYSEAKNLVIDSGRASTSYLQRRFRVGYSRAARLMDMLEDDGVIAPPDGAKPRAVLMTKEVATTLDNDSIPIVGEDK